MPGNFDCESIAKILDAPSHSIRQALQANNIAIDTDDCIPVEVFDKNRDKLQKYLDNQAKEQLAAKSGKANWADEKAKWLADHNAKAAKAASSANAIQEEE